MLFVTRTELYKELNALKKELREDIYRKSNIDIINHSSNAINIKENKDATIDVADVSADLSEAIDDIASVEADICEAVEEIADVVATIVEGLEEE